ncbi:MAG TPA: hypothetical protein VF711_03720, partial [Acidimicrobiales bacterium]
MSQSPPPWPPTPGGTIANLRATNQALVSPPGDSPRDDDFTDGYDEGDPGPTEWTDGGEGCCFPGHVCGPDHEILIKHGDDCDTCRYIRSVENKEKQTDSDPRDRRFRWSSFADLMAIADTPMQWRARGLWATPSFGMLAGESKTLKSHLA